MSESVSQSTNDTSATPSAKQPRHKGNGHRKMRSSLSETRKLPISVNVYDLLPQSKLSSVMWITGIAICHSGVVIDDQEWAFGGHDVAGVSGVYVTKPRDVPENAVYKMTIPIGVTILSDRHIHRELERLKKDFTGPSYDLLHKNCNHFTTEVCKALCGTAPPAWINRIAGFGAKLPLCVSEAWVNPPVAELDQDEEDSALLLPPSEVAPMHRQSSQQSANSGNGDSDDDDSHNDQYLTEASGGKRLSIGSK